MALRREWAPDDHGRVTAGIPALSPSRRRSITDRQLSRLYQQSLQKEYVDNEQNALKGDGAIDDPTDWNQVAGIVLPFWRIMGRLRKLNSNLYFERSSADPSKMGVYLLRNDFQGGQEKHFLCGMEAEMNPEYSLRVTDAEGKPKGIIGGWRRVLMRLIRSGLISESATHRLFGPPSRDSENWVRFTQ